MPSQPDAPFRERAIPATGWTTLELLANGIPEIGSERALAIAEAKGYEVDRERVMVNVTLPSEGKRG